MERRYRDNKTETSSSKDDLYGCLFHIIVPLVFFGGWALYQYYFPKSKEEIAQEKDPNRKIYFDKFVTTEYHPELKSKISRLDSISRTLNEVLYFVDYQKHTLEVQSQNLEALIKENKELEPVVNTKKELVDAIFAVQEKRNAKDKRKDQILGFIYGVLSSIVASIIIFIWNKIRKKKPVTENNSS